jgi:hypothetical protein
MARNTDESAMPRSANASGPHSVLININHRTAHPFQVSTTTHGRRRMPYLMVVLPWLFRPGVGMSISDRGTALRSPSPYLPSLVVLLASVVICASISGCATGGTSLQPATVAAPSGVSSASSPWQGPAVGSVNQLGTISFPVTGQGNVTLLNLTLAAVSGVALTLSSSSWNAAATTQTLTYTYPGGVLHIVGSYTMTATGVSLTLDADQPILSSIDAGAFVSQLQPQTIAVPYYSGTIKYAPTISQYLNAWWDWQKTQATTHIGTGTQYAPKTDGTLNLLHEQLHLAISPTISSVFPPIPNPASPYRAQLAGRIILDDWNATFASSQQGLADLGDYGMSNCAIIIHDWQHFGYDNGLPQHYSADPAFGGDSGLLAAITAAKADGCLAAVHENYTDYYPNYPAFNQASLALNSAGGTINAWLNPENIQSHEAKPSWMIANAQTQSPTIHQRYGTDAAYLDVNSAVAPDERPDMDAKEPLASTVGLWLSNATALWAFERQTHAGPMFGEGANHWYYSGLLDGVEAQLGTGQTATNIGESLPLFVDFDLLRIHPLQVNHGMGYYERWSKSTSTNLSTLEADAYRMQEIAFGHAPFLGDSTWSNVPRAMLESGLVTSVATSYGLAQATSIQYGATSGWVSTSAAAVTKNFAQVQIAYDNGLSVAANSAATPLTWNGLTIPQYGWAAKGAGVLAYTAQCGTTICDYSESPTTLFANARNQADAREGWNYVAPSVAGVTQSSPDNIAVTYNWKVLRQPDPTISYIAFVHFVDDSQAATASQGIVFQGDHPPNPPTPSWQPGTTATDGPVSLSIPSSVPDGTYSVRVGLYDPATGIRLPLAGIIDATGRITVGYLTLSNNGSKITFTPPPPQPNDPRLNAAGSIVNFGKIETDGTVSLQQVNGSWVLRPFPRTRNVTVLLLKAAFPMPASIQTDGGSATPIDAEAYWQIPIGNTKSYSWPTE